MVFGDDYQGWSEAEEAKFEEVEAKQESDLNRNNYKFCNVFFRQYI